MFSLEKTVFLNMELSVTVEMTLVAWGTCQETGSVLIFGTRFVADTENGGLVWFSWRLD